MKNLIVLISMLASSQLISQNAVLTAIDQKNYANLQNLASSVDLNQPIEIDGQKLTALSYAALRGEIEMVNLLIKKGALVSPITDTRDALMYAAKGGNMEIVELLLTKGSNVMNESREGKTARDYAVDSGHVEISVLLQSEMNKIREQAKAKRLKK
ncbi:MAG: ankyrin repeat domain-containing protein [Saprospiraceae bacterium]|nr:ankyrin repeat domain-containing protein [Saprospiraceae bacterium]